MLGEIQDKIDIGKQRLNDLMDLNKFNREQDLAEIAKRQALFTATRNRKLLGETCFPTFPKGNCKPDQY